jgi:microcystin-dependent protein
MANLKVKEGLSTSTSKEVFIKPGHIIMSLITSTPEGFLLCDGSQLLKTSYPELYNEIGIAYGETNGSGGVGTSHFKIPDLVNRYIVPVDTGLSVSGGSYTHSHTVTSNVSIVAKDTSHTHTSGNTNSGAFAWNHGHTANNAYNSGAYGSNPVNANKTGNLGSAAIAGSGHQHPTWTNVNWGYNADGNDVSESHGHTTSTYVNASNNLVATVVNAANQVAHAHNATTTFTTNTSGSTTVNQTAMPSYTVRFYIKV